MSKDTYWATIGGIASTITVLMILGELDWSLYRAAVYMLVLIVVTTLFRVLGRLMQKWAES